MKTRQCIFIGYGQDKYGYRLYDIVEKKLVRICLKLIQFGCLYMIWILLIIMFRMLGDGFDISLNGDVKEE
ncbi:hypothetical protein CR513_25390, partial [Mucuna pruriens]